MTIVKKIVILVATHKKALFEYKSEKFQQIQIGAARSKENLDCLRDDYLDNISMKNPNYCELTAIYWASKNLKADYYGLMHYRRFLVVRDKIVWRFKYFLYYIGRRYKIFPLIRLLKMQLLFQLATANTTFATELITETDAAIPGLLNDFDIILPKKEFMSISVRNQYKKVHFIGHLDKTVNIIKHLYPEIYPYVVTGLNEKYAYCTNMFIMKKEYFELYAEFIFTVLFELEKIIMIPNGKYQKRVFGFMSERLMAPFIAYVVAQKNARIKELNILLLDLK